MFDNESDYDKAEEKLFKNIEKQNPKNLEIYYSELTLNNKGAVDCPLINENSQLLHSC